MLQFSCQRRHTSTPGDDPLPSRACGDHPGAPEPDHDAHDDAQREIDERAATGGLAVTGRPELGRRHREREDDDRGGDAVVQTALHIQRTTQSQWDPLVIDHLRTESGIRGRQCRPDETGEGPGKVVEHHGGNERAEDHREGKADAEQASREGDVSSQLGHVHPCRVREQQERESQLRQPMDRRRRHVNEQRAPGGIPQQVTGDREHQGAGDIEAVQQVRRDRPPENQEHQDGEGGLRHADVLPAS